MEFTPQVKSWIILICIVLGTGSSVTIVAATGGCKLWVAILTGLGAGATNVWTNLRASPNDAPKTN